MPLRLPFLAHLRRCLFYSPAGGGGLSVVTRDRMWGVLPAALPYCRLMTPWLALSISSARISATCLSDPMVIPDWVAPRLEPICRWITLAPSFDRSSARMSATCLTPPIVIPDCVAPLLEPIWSPMCPDESFDMSSARMSATWRTPPEQQEVSNIGISK